MAGLNRYTAQLFSTSGLTGTGGFAAAANGTTTTEVGSSNTPSNIMTGVVGAWAAGWLGATLGASKFPAVEDLNAVDYTFSYLLSYLYERGIPEYDSGTSYNIGDICKGIGNTNIFSSLTNSNSGNALPTPPASNSNWHFCGDLANIGTTNVFTGGTTTGSGNAQVLASLTPSSGFTPSNGQVIVCTAGFTNTGATTLAITSPSISATAINKDSGSGLVALAGGEIVAGDTIYLAWNSTASVFVLTAGLALGTAAFKAASDNTKANVSSVSGSTTSGHIATFADTSGTVQDGGAITNSFGSNGYQFLPGGTLLQWGTGSYANGATVSFPTTFPTAVYNVIVSHGGSDGDSVGATSPTTTGFTFAKGSAGSETIYWQAIGH